MKRFSTLFALLCSLAAQSLFADVEQANPERFAKLIDAENTLLIDVRTPQETAVAKIDGAIEIDFNSPDFKTQLTQLPKDKKLLLYCRSGNRSGQAATYLESVGFGNLVNLDGGMIAWQKEELPVLSQTTE